MWPPNSLLSLSVPTYFLTRRSRAIRTRRVSGGAVPSRLALQEVFLPLYVTVASLPSELSVYSCPTGHNDAQRFDDLIDRHRRTRTRICL